MLKDYKVITSQNLDTLEHEVTSLIREGYTPLGGVVVTVMGAYFNLTQSMVRYDDGDDNVPQ